MIKVKMKAKEYLQQVEKLNRMIDNKLIELEQWKAMAVGITSHSEGERVQGSGDQQKMADAVCRYVDIQSEVNAQIDKMVELKKEVISTIEQLPTVEYDLLHKVYIQFMSFDDVAATYNKHPKWATRLHGSALQKVQKIIDERMVAG